MKRYTFFVLASLLLFVLAACRGTLEAGVEKTPNPHLESALGQLAYVQGGDIWALNLDLPNSEPHRLTTDGRNASPRWSPSGQWLSFHKEQALWVMRADGSDAHSLVAPKQPIEAAWSPVEDRLACVTAQGGLLIVAADGTAKTSLIPDASPAQPEGVERFAWKPDGQWLACQMMQRADLSEEKPPIRQVLRIVRADGSESADLYAETDPMETSIRLVGWSGDGMYILFWRGPASASLQADGVPLMSIPASGGNPQAIATEAVLTYTDFVVPQPSTSRLAVVLGSGRESWVQKRLVFVDADGQSLTSFDGGQAIAAPAWSPDGQQVAYVGISAKEGVAGGEEARKTLNERRIWVVEANGTGWRQLTNDPGYRDERPLWSADGRHILFARIHGSRAGLWLMDKDGSNLRQVVEELTPAPDWFSYYGHVEWGRLFDWWTGLHQIPERPITLPTPASAPSPSSTATPTSSEAGLVYLKDGVLFMYGGSGEDLLGRLPENVGHLALGTHCLAYIQGNQVKALNLGDGTTHILLDFGPRPGQDFDLYWSNDSSALAYAVAWNDPDGSRKVELGTSDGYEQQVVDTLVAQSAGPRPTLTPELPLPPEPGFANLRILGFDRANGRLAVTQTGGHERYSAVWFYDYRTGRRVETIPLATDIQEVSLSPDMTWLAVARASALQVWPLGTNAPPVQIELPADTHARWLAWSPDSQRLMCLLHKGVAPSLETSPSLSLWVWEAQTGQPRQVAPTVSPEGTLHGWTADGKAVLVELLDGISRKRTVSLVEVTTGQASRIPLPEGSQVLGWIGGVCALGVPALPEPTPALLPGALTVEEYPIVAKENDAPGRLEYMRLISPTILARRRPWREPSAEEFLAPFNAALAPFGYRLSSKEKPGYSRPFYNLYKNNTLVQPDLSADLSAIWPVIMTNTGDDFALLVEDSRSLYFLVGRDVIKRWNPSQHAFIPPVFVGSDLVTVETNDQQRFAVRWGNEVLYNFTVPGPRVDNPVKGLWSWEGHWVLE